MYRVLFDNDLGFTGRKGVAEGLNVDTFFTKSYTNQDKGIVENRIGQIIKIISANFNLLNLGEAYTSNQVLQEKISLITLT